MAGLIFLHVPWGLIGLSPNRVALPDSTVRLDTNATIAPMLFCGDEKPIFLNGRSDALEGFTNIRTRLRERQRVWDIPIPLQIDEPQSIRHESWRSEISFLWASGVNRPVRRSEDRGAVQEPGEPAYRFILSVMGRMQDFEAALTDGADPWEFVLERWLDPEVTRDPTMDILVRHAQQHRERWSNIAENPRRLLNRRRELVPLSRVQELDTQCMEWLSRQPGETLAERAGGRQRILALARFENRNTLENRVLRDLLERTVGAAREYLTLNAGRVRGALTRRTGRYALVQQYQRESRRLSLELALQDVDRVTDAVQPNYVLLYDHRYRHVWTAWKELIQRERVMDDLWRWQRRSWSEFCKAAIVMALMAQSHTHRVAASPVFVRGEHRRGEWLLHDDPLAVVAHEKGNWVVEVLSGNSHDVPEKIKELGASVWLRLSDYSGGTYKYLPIWTVHSLRTDVSLIQLVGSANEAFQFLRDKTMLAGGVVLQSTLDPGAPMTSLAAQYVSGFSFGPWDSQLVDALGLIGEELSALIEAAL